MSPRVVDQGNRHPVTLLIEEHDPRLPEGPGVRWLLVAECQCGCNRRWTFRRGGPNDGLVGGNVEDAG